MPTDPPAVDSDREPAAGRVGAAPLLTFAALEAYEWLNLPAWVYDGGLCHHWWANAAGLAFWHAASVPALCERDYSGSSESSKARIALSMQAHARGESTFERWTLFPDGVPTSILLQGTGIRLPDGRVGILFVAERGMPVEPMLARAVEAINHAGLLVAVHALADGKTLMRNPAAAIALGAVASEATTGAFERMFTDAAAGPAVLARVQAGETVRGQAELATATGPRWHQFEARAAQDPVTGDGVLEFHASDVSELISTQRALELARSRAEAATQAKTSFLATMSHEIRTPMNGVIGTADLLARATLAPRERQLVQTIRDSAGALMGILDDILDFARMEAQGLALHASAATPANALRTTLALHAGTAQTKGLRLRSQLDASCEDVFLFDGLRLAQLVGNLVGNAVKFTDRGEVAVMAHVDPVGMLEVLVTDTGIGFDMAELARLLQPFEQADARTTRRKGGSGLGLSICRQLCELIGGTMDIESTVGAGTRVRLALPLGAAVPTTPAADSVAVVPAPGAAPEASPGAAMPQRVLVVEDNEVNRTVLVAMLAHVGVPGIEQAESGEQALECMGRERFDLVLMDWHMPGMDGLETIARIRTAEVAAAVPPVAIVAVTASAMAGDRERCLAAGADGYASKPLLVDELRAALVAAHRVRRAP